MRGKTRGLIRRWFAAVLQRCAARNRALGRVGAGTRGGSPRRAVSPAADPARAFSGGSVRGLDVLEPRILLNGDPVQVAGVAAGPSGFEAELTKTPALEKLNLHDGADEAQDPPDLKLTAPSGDPVSGSLVWEPAESELRFVAAEAPLAPGAYSLEIPSRPDGLVGAASGEPLDGNGDGEAGGAFTRELTIDPSDGRAVAVPSFAREPGQGVNVPAPETGLPIRIDDAGGLTAAELTLEYDPALLDVTRAFPSAALPSGWDASLTAAAAGEVTLSLSGDTALSTGMRELAVLDASVPSDASPGRSAALAVTEVTLDGGEVQARGLASVQVASVFGDADRDGRYTGLDASLIARTAVGVQSGFDAHDRIAPSVIGDPDSDARLTGLDASFVARRGVGLAQPELPPLAGELPAVPAVDGALANDTGTSAADAVTRDPTVAGAVENPRATAALRAGLGDTATDQFVDVSEALARDGAFTLGPTLLERVNGGSPLPDGARALRLIAEDADGNTSEERALSFELDTRAPTLQLSTDLDGTTRRRTFDENLPVTFNEAVGSSSVADTDAFTLQRDGSPVSLSEAPRANGRDAEIVLDAPLPDGDYTLTTHTAVEDRAGNPLGSPKSLSFTIADPPGIERLSPKPGADMVNVALEPQVRFDEAIDPATIDAQSVRVLESGQPIEGSLDVNATDKAVTFFPAQPLPDSTELTLEIDGDAIIGADGQALDADGDDDPGGRLSTSFRTLPLTRVEGTDVFGFVKSSMTDEALEGVTLRLDAFPEVTATTNAEGLFVLEDVPAPEFFVEIDGSTAEGVPEGKMYPTLGKSFPSVAGESTQLAKNGAPLDLHLPLMAQEDVTSLNNDGPTDVGLGDFAMQQARQIVGDDASAADLEELEVTFPAGAAQDDAGNEATDASILPVPPDRLPGELPSFMDTDLVFSVQAGMDGGFNENGGATRFDEPAPVTVPNLDDLSPGSKTRFFSFNHDKGEFEPVARGTVSSDGETISTDPGEGLLNPGWHSSESTTSQPVQSIGALPADDGEEESGGTDGGTGGGGSDDGGIGSTVEDFNRLKRHTFAGVANFMGAVASIAGFGSSAPARLVSQAVNESGRAFGVAATGADDARLNRGDVRAEAFDAADNITGKPGFGAAGTANSLDAMRSNFAEAEDAFNDLLSIDAGGGGAPVRPAPLRAAVNEPDPSTTIQGLNRNELSALEASIDRIVEGGTKAIEGIRDVRVVLAEIPTSDPQLVQQFVDGAEKLTEAHTLLVEEGPGSLERMFRKVADQANEVVRILEDNDFIDLLPAEGAYYRLKSTEGGDVVARGQFDQSGRIDVQLAPRTSFDVALANPLVNTYAQAQLVSGPSGSDAAPLQIKLREVRDDPGDTDDDGLLDRVEGVLPTAADSADTDGDGINDRAEYLQGSNPTDGRGLPTGIVSTVLADRVANDLAVAGAPGQATGQRAYVATNEGLAVVDASDADRLVVEGELSLPGESEDVAFDPLLDVATVATGEDGLHFVDVSMPSGPSLLSTSPFDAEVVAMDAGTAYGAGFNDADPKEPVVRTYDAFQGRQIAEQDLNASAEDMALNQGDLFVLSGVFGNELARFEAQPDLQPPSETVDVNGGNKIRAGANRLFVHDGDRNQIQVRSRDPGMPALFSSGTSAFGAFDLGDATLALYGGGTPSPLESDLNLLDVESTGGSVLARHVTPGQVTGVEVASGRALVADGAEGLQAINYQPFDADGNAPNISIDTEATDVDAETAGVQVVEGRPVQVVADARDDQQIRDVEFLVDGAVVRRDVDFPFAAPVLAPRDGGDRDSFTVQARATDTGGNSATSQTESFELVGDADDPDLTAFAAEVGADGRRALELGFSEPMAMGNVASSTFSLEGPEGATLAFQQSRQTTEDDGATLTLFYEPLPNEGTYELTIDAPRVTDRGGNALGSDPQTRSFGVTNPRPTASLSEPTAPVATSSPVLRIDFSEPIKAQTLRRPAPIRLEPADGGGTHAPTITKIRGAGTALELAFFGVPAGTYDVVADADEITDREGKPIAPGQDLTIGSLELQQDTAGPELLDATVAKNQFGASTLILRFDEPLPSSSVNRSTFRAENEQGTGLGITPNRRDLGRSVRIAVPATAPDNVVLGLDPSQAVDAAGHSIVGPSGDLEVPAISGTTPASDSTVRPGRSTVNVAFSEALSQNAFQPDRFALTNRASGNALTPQSVTAQSSRTAAELDFGTQLPTAQYELRLSAERIQDEDDGLPLGITDPARSFTIAQGFNVLAQSPQDGDTVRAVFGALTVDLSRASDPATVTPAHFQLHDPDGNVVTPDAFSLTDGDTRIEIAYPVLGEGEHELVIDAPQVEEAHGDDVLGQSPRTTAFTVRGTPHTLLPEPLTGIGGADMAVLDLDGDGHDDVVHTGQGGVVTRLGLGGGFYSPAPGFEAGFDLRNEVRGAPAALAPGDFDGDGVPDLVVVSRFVEPGDVLEDIDGDGIEEVADRTRVVLSLLLGDGTGAFDDTAMVELGDDADLRLFLESSETRVSNDVVVGELTGDGHLDAAALNPDDDTLHLVPGDGQGGLGGATTVYTAGDTVRDLAPADVDGGGPDDLALATDGGLLVLTAEGAGGFAAARQVGAAARTVTAGDLDGDGHGDLAAIAGSPDELRVLLNDGAGSFTESATAGLPHGPVTASAELADVTGDGAADLYAAAGAPDGPYETDPAGAILLVPGDGAGGLGSPRALQTDTTVVTSGAFDDDAHRDLFVDGEVLRGLPGGGFDTAERIAPFAGAGGATGTLPEATGDFDEDGRPDLVVSAFVDGQEKLRVLTGDGMGGYSASATFSGIDVSNANVVVGDFDGDGHRDIVGLDRTVDSFFVRLGAGDGTFTAAAGFDLAGASTLVPADLDGDGDDDLAVGSGTQDNVRVLTSEGDGTFASAQVVASGRSVFDLAAGDFNGNGVAGLAAASKEDGDVRMLLNDGAGAFNAVDRAFSLAAAPEHLVARDLEGDGDLDVVTANPASGSGHSVSRLVNDGQGRFTKGPALTVPENEQPKRVAVADVNGDGRRDIVTINDAGLDERTIGVLVAKADGTYTDPFRFDGGDAPFGEARLFVGELDGVAGLELLIAGYRADEILVL